ncbi:hypothetical protein KCU71_g1265, partial [Aureobasidium melanogenum]
MSQPISTCGNLEGLINFGAKDGGFSVTYYVHLRVSERMYSYVYQSVQRTAIVLCFIVYLLRFQRSDIQTSTTLLLSNQRMDTILMAKLLAIPCGFLSGSYAMAFSQNVMPHLYKQPASVVAPIFAETHKIGPSTILLLVGTAVLAYSYLAYSSTPSKRQLYVTAAALTFATLPMGRFVMKPTISRLLEFSRTSTVQATPGLDQEVTKLLKAWVAQNYFRASLHLNAGFVGLYAALT